MLVRLKPIRRIRIYKDTNDTFRVQPRCTPSYWFALSLILSAARHATNLNVPAALCRHSLFTARVHQIKDHASPEYSVAK